MMITYRSQCPMLAAHLRSKGFQVINGSVLPSYYFQVPSDRSEAFGEIFTRWYDERENDDYPFDFYLLRIGNVD